MNVTVGSKNPVKIKAVQKAFELRFEEEINISSAEVSSGVSEQPFNDEARQGALIRAKKSLEINNTDYGVGLEGGVMQHGDQYFTSAWCVIVNKQGKEGYGHSIGVQLPSIIVEKIKQGMQLGDAHDYLTGQENTKQKNGFFGLSTDNIITREHGYRDMIVAALAPFKLPQYYK